MKQTEIFTGIKELSKTTNFYKRLDTYINGLCEKDKISYLKFLENQDFKSIDELAMFLEM